MKQREQVAIYLRISREHGETEDSLANHRSTLKELAESNDWGYTIYSDGVMSSQDNNRPEYLRMIDDIKSGHYTALLVHEVSRIGRRGSELLRVADILELHCPTVITPVQKYDLKEDSSKMIFSFQSIFSEQEYKATARRLSQGKYKSAESGRSLSSIVAYGYRKDDAGKLVPDEDESKVYRLAIDMALQGYSMKYVSKHLNELGYRGKKGKPFSHVTAHRFIHNPVYRGTLVYNNSAGEVYKEDNHEALLSKQEYSLLIDMAKKRRTHYSKVKNTKALFITAGMYRCNDCDKRLSVNRTKKTNKDGSTRYVMIVKGCPNKECTNYGTGLDGLEDAVIKSVQGHAGEIKEELEALQSNDMSSMVNGFKDKIADVDKGIKDIESKEQNLISLAVSGALSTQELIDQRAIVNKDKERLQEQRTNYEDNLESLDSTALEKRLNFMLCNVDKLQSTRQIMNNPNYTEEQADEIIVKTNSFLKSIISRIGYHKAEQGKFKVPELFIEWAE